MTINLNFQKQIKINIGLCGFDTQTNSPNTQSQSNKSMKHIVNKRQNEQRSRGRQEVADQDAWERQKSEKSEGEADQQEEGGEEVAREADARPSRRSKDSAREPTLALAVSGPAQNREGQTLPQARIQGENSDKHQSSKGKQIGGVAKQERELLVHDSLYTIGPAERDPRRESATGEPVLGSIKQRAQKMYGSRPRPSNSKKSKTQLLPSKSITNISSGLSRTNSGARPFEVARGSLKDKTSPKGLPAKHKEQKLQDRVYLQQIGFMRYGRWKQMQFAADANQSPGHAAQPRSKTHNNGSKTQSPKKKSKRATDNLVEQSDRLKKLLALTGQADGTSRPQLQILDEESLYSPEPTPLPGGDPQMWSHGEETGALVENSSSRDQLLGAGSQESPAVTMQQTVEQDRGVKSPHSEMTFALEEDQSRKGTHNFAATVGPAIGGKNLLMLDSQREEEVAKVDMGLQDKFERAREVPPAGGVRYGSSLASLRTSERVKPEQQQAPTSSRLSSVGGAHRQGKSRPGPTDDNIIRVVRARKQSTKVSVASNRVGTSNAANQTPGPGSRVNVNSQLARRIQPSPNSRYFGKSRASEMCRRSSQAFLNRPRRSTASRSPPTRRGDDEQLEANQALEKHPGPESNGSKMQSAQFAPASRSPDPDPYRAKMKIQLQTPSRSRLLNIAVIKPVDIQGYQDLVPGHLVPKTHTSATNWQQQYWESMFPRRNSKAKLPEPLKRDRSSSRLHQTFDQIKKQLSRTRLAATVVDCAPSRHNSRRASQQRSPKGRQAPDFALKR